MNPLSTPSRQEKLKQLLAQSPNDAFLHFGLAMELAKSSEIEEAVREFDRVLELDPHYVGAYMHKGSTLISAGRIEEARSTLEQGIRVSSARGDEHACSEMDGLLQTLPPPQA